MKYMGSKRMMLLNGLGELLEREVPGAARFVDLFTGSGAVASHVACKYDIPVAAFDLQQYSIVLARSIVGRKRVLRRDMIWNSWIARAKIVVGKRRIPTLKPLTRKRVLELRQWCEGLPGFPIANAYGGHYFSPKQSVWIDALRRSVPREEPARTSAIAARIHAASYCAAAPGHTAQPFQPTRTAKHFLAAAWRRDAVGRTKECFFEIANQHAKCLGIAEAADANRAVRKLRKGDLVFIDPPYSAVQYSRFYHVFETIADGTCGDVSGTGRYPVPEFRPRSRYSVKTEAFDAIEDLLRSVATSGARAVLTFPDHECSNGLSGEMLRDTAMEHFVIKEQVVKSRFSTLGGNGVHQSSGRTARQNASELVLLLQPR